MRLARLRPLIVALAIAWMPPALALDAAETEAVRGAIAGQIEALRRDDAAGAYGFAAPGIKRLFPDESAFMAMVKRGYAPVYRPNSFKFGELRETDLGPAQIVDIVDSEGQAWRALYTLEKQPDGTWRISGCHIIKAPGEAA